MKTKVLTRVTMMVALMIVSGVLTIPLPGLPVPIVLQNMMMMLAGGLLGKKFGTEKSGAFINGVLDNVLAKHPELEKKNR